MLKLLLKNVEEILFGQIFFGAHSIAHKQYQNTSGFAGGPAYIYSNTTGQSSIEHSIKIHYFVFSLLFKALARNICNISTISK